MSKPVKNMIVSAYERKFDALDGAIVIDIRGVDSNTNNAIRQELRKQQIHITIVRNALVKKALTDTKLAGLFAALEGPSALVYGAESVVDVARAIVDWAKKIEKLDLKGAVLDGEYFEGAAGVKRLSTFPTREEALAKAVQIVLSPGSNLVGAIKSPGAKLLAIVKEIQTRHEDGKAIEKVA